MFNIISHLRIKTTVTYCYTLIRVTKKITLNPGKDVEKQNHSYTAGGNVEWYSHSGK